MTVLALIVVLGVLVFVHELGHFLAAKWAGIYVHRFSLGLGSPVKALSFRRGETEYAVSWLPLGGYVKMASAEEEATSAALEGGAGEFTEAPVPPDRVFEAKPVWKRMIVILAGVTMNFLFAFGVNTYLAAKHGRTLDMTTTVGHVQRELATGPAAPLAQLAPGDRIVRVNGQPVESWDAIVQGISSGDANEVTLDLADGRRVVLPIHPAALEARAQAAAVLAPYRATVVDTVIPGSPAAAAGVERGDSITALGGRPVAQFYDVLAVLDTSAGKPVAVSLVRDGRPVELTVRTRVDQATGPDGKPHKVGRLGVGFRSPVRTIPYDFPEAVRAGFGETLHQTTFIARTVQGLLTRRVATSSLGGPILIAQQAGQFARLGLDQFLGFMALISVNLAVLNLLPIPVLDGGQFVFLLAEGIARRPLPLKVRERLTTVGLALILGLMVMAFWNDFARLFRGWGWIQ
ncbi:MAG TPA: RIP metalloprotease RseP [Gemmatimonadales bacterium]|nr:RIP metalloprotease RseP [Gemmatimonadales bacterium]